VTQCEFGGCERPSTSRDLCDAHYQQWRAGKELRPIRNRTRRTPAICIFEGCDRPTRADSLCYPHYQQKARGGELQPLFTLRQSQATVNELRARGLKRCKICDTMKPFAKFGPSRTTMDGRAIYCSDCAPDYQTAKRFRFESVAALRAFRAARDYRCDLCQTQWVQGSMAFAIDHDGRGCCPDKYAQTCGMCVRGYLCEPCNRLGLAWYEKVGRAVATIPLFENYLTAYEKRRAEADKGRERDRRR
jgi:Recombination endonuclease VII